MSERETVETIETQVALLMRRADATQRADPDAPHRALDRAAYLVLRKLEQDGPQLVGELAKALGLDGSTVTRQVSGLERDGLVKRGRSDADGRAIVVTPTERGLHRMEGVRAARIELYGRILSEWDEQDRADLGRLLSRLNRDMERRTRTFGTASAISPAD
jgi:DNA-binding MarR family transcriptional regulator